jgi:hypothetical protein
MSIILRIAIISLLLAVRAALKLNAQYTGS